MTGQSKLTTEGTENKESGGRLRKGSMYSDGSELRDDNSKASEVGAFFKLITDTLAKVDYNSFLKVMRDFRAGRTDLEGVENKLKDLFSCHPELVLGLNKFLPNDNEVILSGESEKPEQLETKQQVSKRRVPLKQEKCREKTKREMSEQDNEGPQVADSGGDGNPERVPLDKADLQRKTKRGKIQHENESHQALESASYMTEERMPFSTQNVEQWHEVELRVYPFEGSHPANMWPLDPITATEVLPTNQMLSLHSKQATRPRTLHADKGTSLTRTKPLLQDLTLPSLVTDIHERLRSFSECLSRNKLLIDPMRHEHERKTMNPWTPEEKQLFLEKFKVFRKSFSEIASYLENKRTADCVEYYYLNKKSGDLEILRRRQKQQSARHAR